MQFEEKIIISYLWQHWSELHHSWKKERQGQNVKARQIRSPFKQSDEMNNHNHEGCRENQEKNDGPLEVVARVIIGVLHDLAGLLQQLLAALHGHIPGRFLGQFFKPGVNSIFLRHVVLWTVRQNFLYFLSDLGNNNNVIWAIYQFINLENYCSRWKKLTEIFGKTKIWPGNFFPSMYFRSLHCHCYETYNFQMKAAEWWLETEEQVFPTTILFQYHIYKIPLLILPSSLYRHSRHHTHRF